MKEFKYNDIAKFALGQEIKADMFAEGDLLSGLNRMAGGLFGMVAGCVTILGLYWAVMRFAPTENLGLLSRPCLLQSFTGGFLSRLFVPTL